MSRIISGRLVFKQAGPARPIHHAPLRVSVHHALWLDEHVGEVRTDSDGHFEVDVAHAGRCTIRLVLLEHRRVYQHTGAADEATAAGQIDIAVEEGLSDLGDVQLAYWPYRTDFPSPRAGMVQGKWPQSYTTGYKHTLELAFARVLPSQLMLHAEHAVAHARPTMDEIQSHQPATRTIRAEQDAPGTTRSDTWLADQILNGFDVELRVGRDADDPARLRARIAWPDMACKGEFDLADADVVIEERDSELAVSEITLRIRRAGKDGAWADDTTRRFTSADGADWEAAKRVTRCQYLLHGAMDGHIIRSHFQTEMYAVAAFRNLRVNPVAHVLLPHLQEIVAQDHDGDSFAWGPGGLIPEQSALTMAHILERTGAKTGGWDWKTFRPRTPVHPSHRYAHAAGVYWDLLGEHLSKVFADHEDAIVANWIEVLRFSEDLVTHSPPYVPQVDEPGVIPIDRNELDHPEVARAVIDGVTRAVRPVTQTAAPQPGELADLMQLCRYVIYQATFNHSWTHDGQYDAGGELRYATFALRGGSLGAEDDPDIAPAPGANIDSISTNTVGLHANYGYIIADEERDVPPSLKAALEARRQDLAALGVDVDKIRSRINI